LLESAAEDAKFEAAMIEAARVEAAAALAQANRIRAARAEADRVRAAREEVFPKKPSKPLTGIVSANDLAWLLSQ
jgi:hypothetical protein